MKLVTDLKAAVADLQAAQEEQLTAIDVEIQQLADALKNSGGLSVEDQATLNTSVANISQATAALRASTAALTADDPPAAEEPPAPV